MKKLILDDREYTFEASQKKVTIKAHSDLLKLEYLLLITNTTKNQIIYNFGCIGYGATVDEIRKTILLEYDTTSMDNSDRLQIILYTEQSETETILNDLSTTLENVETTMENIEQLLITQNKLLKKILN